jgi:hypothetical protein
VPNKVYQLHPVSAASALIITQATRNELAGGQIPVNLVLVLGANQYRAKDVMIPTVPAARDIVNAWWRTVSERHLKEPNFEGLSHEPGDYAICDGKGNDCDPIVTGMDICLTPIPQIKPMTPEVNLWITATVKDLDGHSRQVGTQQNIDRNMPKQQVLDLWRRTFEQQDDLREIVAKFPSDAAVATRPTDRDQPAQEEERRSINQTGERITVGKAQETVERLLERSESGTPA